MKAPRHVAALSAAVAILAISGAAIAKDETQPVFDEAAGVWKDPRTGSWYDEKKGAWMPEETAPVAREQVRQTPMPILPDGDSREVTSAYMAGFELTEIPADAKLHIGFAVLQAGICPLTYQPTVVRLNGQKIKEVDFRERSGQEDLEIDVPPNLLRVGENSVKVTMGKCQYKADKMRLNDLRLL